MPPTITAVLFDYGQVLTGPPDPAAWALMRRITALDEPAFHAAYWHPRHDYDRGALNGLTYWAAVARHAGIDLDPANISALNAADTALWTQPNLPMIAWASRLQTAGTRTGILSNLGDAMMHGVLRTFPWLTRFDYLLWSHTLGLAKPNPAIYLHAARGLAAPHEQILFVDDREDNIRAAHELNFQTIEYTSQLAFEAELLRRGLGPLWENGSLS